MTNYAGPPITDPVPNPPADLPPDAPDCVVSVVVVVPDPPTATNVALINYPYQGWGQTTIVERDTGLRLQAVQGPPGTPCDPIRVHAGKGKKTVTGVAVRIGAHPQIPSADTRTANETLVHAKVAAFSPQLIPSGTRGYGFVWHYEYDLAVPFQETDYITFGQPPSDAGPAEQLNPADYLSYLNAPSLPPAGAPTGPVDF